MLEIKKISLSRGLKKLISNFSLTVNYGEAVRIVGENGVGKTTLLKKLALISELSPMEYFYNGVDIYNSDESFKYDAIYLGHNLGLKEELTVYDNIFYTLKINKSNSTPSDIVEVLKLLSMDSQIDLPIKYLSQGQKRKVLLSYLWLLKKRIWILDEPFVALDGKTLAIVENKLINHINNGNILIYTTHQNVSIKSKDVCLDKS